MEKASVDDIAKNRLINEGRKMALMIFREHVMHQLVSYVLYSNVILDVIRGCPSVLII